jgi:Glycosyltransferase family 9 (heptosyltransferase)
VVRAGALGDVLLLRGALAGLQVGGLDVTLLAPRLPGQLLLGIGARRLWPWEGPDVARLFADPGSLPPALVARLREVNSALAVTRDPSLLAVLRRYVSRVVALDPTPPSGIHAARWLLEAARELGAPGGVRVPPLVGSPSDREHAGEILRALPPGFPALHPGSGSPRKNWPVERYAALARALAPDAPFALVGGPADDEVLAHITPLAPGAIVLRNLPLGVLGTVLAEASVFVGNDSGITHLAAAFGAPTLALFGPTDPLNWAPVGERVQALRAARGELQQLDTHVVVEAASRLRCEARARRAGSPDDRR